MKLYKYISSESALLNIIKGSIKFATLDTLNDPTELLPNIYESELIKSLKNKRSRGYTQQDLIDLKKQESLFQLLSPETMVIKAPQTIEAANSILGLAVYDNLDYLKEMFEKTIEIMALRCGIFCVSKRFNSLPMWAHYANNAEGYVIEFENLQNVFLGDKTGILNEVKDVTYKLNRTGINFESGTYKSLFFEKDKDWEYESEKRVITNLSSCSELNIGSDLIYTKQIDKSCITKVIFGWKVSDEIVKKLTTKCHQINPNLKATKSVIRNGKIEDQ